MKHRSPMFFVVWALIVLLIVLHQDNWLWNNPTLVFGFLPITLLYHMGISLGATVTWLLATRFAWPEDAKAARHVGLRLTYEGGQA